MLSTRTTRQLKRIALALTLAALAVPPAQAGVMPAGKYGGPLDPWAYNAIHQSTQSVPLITEHSAGQNGRSQPSAAGKYGTLDAVIANAIRSHSAAQKGVSRSAAASVSASVPGGFKWRDAGFGAGIAFAAILLATGVATLILRRGRSRLASL